MVCEERSFQDLAKISDSGLRERRGATIQARAVAKRLCPLSPAMGGFEGEIICCVWFGAGCDYFGRAAATTTQ